MAIKNLLLKWVRQRHGKKAASLMSDFFVGQKWVMADPIFGIFYGEVAEVSDDSQSGTVVITDGEVTNWIRLSVAR